MNGHAYPKYERYKDTGVEWLGKIPDHWDATPLFRILKERFVRNTGNRVQDVLSLSYGKIVPRDVDSNFGLLPESFETYQIVEPGNIILRLTDLQNDRRSLRVGHAMQRGIVTSAYVNLESVADFDNRYAYYLLNAYDRLKVFYGMGAGVRQTMKYADLKRMSCVLPPLPEQAAIAAFLDRETARIDALIEKQERLIKKLEEKRKALISRAVTQGLNSNVRMKDSGVECLGRIPEHWRVKRLKHLLVGIDQGFSPQCEGTPAGPGEWGVLKVGCVNYGVFRDDENKRLPSEITPQEKFHVRPGDLLVSRANGNPDLVGSCAIAEPTAAKLLLSDKTFRLRLSQGTDAGFVYFCLNGQAVRRQIRHGTSGAEGLANNITQGAIGNLVLALPNEPEQLAIVGGLRDRIADMDRASARVQRLVDRLRERRTALISAAVTGKIDVKEAT